jgi:hypothetical protein
MPPTVQAKKQLHYSVLFTKEKGNTRKSRDNTRIGLRNVHRSIRQ